MHKKTADRKTRDVLKAARDVEAVTVFQVYRPKGSISEVRGEGITFEVTHCGALVFKHADGSPTFTFGVGQWINVGVQPI